MWIESHWTLGEWSRAHWKGCEESMHGVTVPPFFLSPVPKFHSGWE